MNLRLRTGHALVLAAAGALLLAACGSSSTSSPTATTRAPSASVVRGGTVTWAESPGAPPNFILPYTPGSYASANNGAQFQVLMYRPLYWFGNGSSATLNTALSLASIPHYEKDNTVAVLDVKHWKWSDGEPVDAADVLFWINMLRAVPTGWAAYIPGDFPDNVTNAIVTGKYQLTLDLNHAYSPTWFTSNELSQITPLPEAWDITHVGAAPGSGRCATASYRSIVINGTTSAPLSASAKDCAAVYDFLSREAGYNPTNPSATDASALSSYGTNPLWQVVDGPWHLVSLSSTGRAVFEPNPHYSGPDRPRISKFIELPFTSAIAEYNALLAGAVDVGYLPSSEITSSAPSPGTAGANNPGLAGAYHLEVGVPWAINYFVLNYNSTGDGGVAGRIFRQLYFRQALQSLVSQRTYIDKIYKNYAVPTYGPVPTTPPTWASSLERSDLYPYSPHRAASLLSSHGWHVVRNGVSSCIRPGTGADECGGGIPRGALLSFNLFYASGTPTLTQLMDDEAAAWAQAGIKVSLSEKGSNAVLGDATACATGCSWEMANWGTTFAWSYDPDYYPTGGEIFGTGAGLNQGSYNSSTNDINLERAHTTASSQSLYTYEDYLARQLPVIWQPVVANLAEVKDGLQIGPLNPVYELTPESWYFTRS